MPQLDLYGRLDRVAIHWDYSIDPTKPEEPAMLYCFVSGNRDLAVEHGLSFVPLNVVHEAVADVLASTWDAYLFGEPDDVRQTFGRTMTKWRREAATRPAV